MSWTTGDSSAYVPFMASMSLRAYRSTVGRKAIMATTGGVLVLYLFAHMIGNLKIFLGRRDFDGYASWLRSMGEPALPHRTVLTVVELVLSLSVLIHMWAAVSLARTAAGARPVKYAARLDRRAGGYATYTMRYGGVVIAAFVVWHLLDLTFGVANPSAAAHPYEKVVADFSVSRWYVTAFYVVAVGLVGLHLKHGLWSALQSLGLGGGRYRAMRLGADLLAGALVAGFVSVPFFVMIGVVR